MDVQEMATAFDALRGKTGTHYDLANEVEALGLTVDMDPDNNERSMVKLTGVWLPDGSDAVIGQILGDTEAQIV